MHAENFFFWIPNDPSCSANNVVAQGQARLSSIAGKTTLTIEQTSLFLHSKMLQLLNKTDFYLSGISE